MKKLFSLVACLLCAVMLSATGFAASEPDAYTIYKKATKHLQSATSIETSGTNKMKMEALGVEIASTTEKYTAKQMKAADGKLLMESHSSDPETGAPISDTYYKDGYIYTKTGNAKSKQKFDIDSMASAMKELDGGLKKEWFNDAEIEQTADGTRLKFKIKFSELGNGMGASILDELSNSIPDAKIKVGNVAYSMLIGSDGKLKSYAVAYTITIESQDMTIKAKCNTSEKIVSVNKVDKINFPADLGSYKQPGQVGSVA